MPVVGQVYRAAMSLHGPGDTYSGAPYWVVDEEDHYIERILAMLSIWVNGPLNADESDFWIASNFPLAWEKRRTNLPPGSGNSVRRASASGRSCWPVATGTDRYGT